MASDTSNSPLVCHITNLDILIGMSYKRLTSSTVSPSARKLKKRKRCMPSLVT